MRQAAGDRSIETVLEAATILGVIGLDRWKVATLGGAIDTYRLLWRSQRAVKQSEPWCPTSNFKKT